MNNIFFLIGFFMLAYTCKREGKQNDQPDIIFEKKLPHEMDNYSHFRNPIVYNNFLIVTNTNTRENKSTFFKLDKNGNFLDKWNVDNNHALGNYLFHNEIYFYNNHLIYNSKYFGVRDQKIICVDLNNMETSWQFSSTAFRSGLIGLENKIYLLKDYTNSYEVYEINLDNKNINFVYQSTLGSYGSFTFLIKPTIYKIDVNNLGILTTSSSNNSYTLINYNITTQELIWEIDLPEFNYLSGPTNVQLKNEKIIITSNDKISVRNLANGELKWSKPRSSSFVVDRPVIGDEVIIDSTDKLFCYDIENGGLIWTREDQEDGVMVGTNENKIIYKDFFFDVIPINIHTGKARWVNLGPWNNLELDFEGKPAIDKNTDDLYYIGYYTRKLYKVRMPD